MKNLLTIGVLALLGLPLTAPAQHAREAVIAAETGFAATAKQAGTKAAFLASCAPTAFVTDGGKLANAQEVWAARPAQAAARLSWYPVLADAAQSDDLGYTTGPWTAWLNERAQAAGEYVTVWRKQPDGQWKFVVDMGIERIGVAPAPTPEVPAPRLPVAVATPSAAPSNILLDLDRRFDAAELIKPGATYQQYLSEEARLYRPGLSMMHGAAAVANMKNLDRGYLFTPANCYLAAAGDLGYVVGSLHRGATGTTRPEETGSYLRIWRREATAGWRVVLEVLNMTPDSVPVPAKAAGVSTASPGTVGQTH